MDIYSDNSIYGIKWYMYDSDYNIIKSFEKIYNNKMTSEQIKEVKEEYDKLTDFELYNMIFNIYISCSSTYGSGTFMRWFPCNKDELNIFLLD